MWSFSVQEMVSLTDFEQAVSNTPLLRSTVAKLTALSHIGTYHR